MPFSVTVPVQDGQVQLRLEADSLFALCTRKGGVLHVQGRSYPCGPMSR